MNFEKLKIITKQNKKVSYRKLISCFLIPVMIVFTVSPCFAYETISHNYPAFVKTTARQAACRGALSRRSSIRAKTEADKRSLEIMENPFKYSGYYKDPESQMYYLNARYYSPELMRFISKDTYDLSNRYAYCEGNPISSIDPSGHFSIPKWANYALAGAGIVGGIAGAAFSGGSSLAIAGGVLGALSGGAQIGAEFTDGDTSKGLNIASTVLGIASIGFNAATAIKANSTKAIVKLGDKKLLTSIKGKGAIPADGTYVGVAKEGIHTYPFLINKKFAPNYDYVGEYISKGNLFKGLKVTHGEVFSDDVPVNKIISMIKMNGENSPEKTLAVLNKFKKITINSGKEVKYYKILDKNHNCRKLALDMMEQFSKQ